RAFHWIWVWAAASRWGILHWNQACSWLSITFELRPLILNRQRHEAGWKWGRERECGWFTEEARCFLLLPQGCPISRVIILFGSIHWGRSRALRTYILTPVWDFSCRCSVGRRPGWALREERFSENGLPSGAYRLSREPAYPRLRAEQGGGAGFGTSAGMIRTNREHRK